LKRDGSAILIHALNITLPLLYALTVGAYGKAFFSDHSQAKRVKTPLLAVTVALHFVYLLSRTAAFAHPPVTTIFEILSVLSFSVAVTYLFIELRSHRKETGYFIINIAFFFQLASTLFIRDLTAVPEILRSNIFGIHVTSALLGYAAITISGAYGFLYLMLYHEMKASRFGVVYKKLPTLETLERMTMTANRTAFTLLTVAIIFGYIWLYKVFSTLYLADPKLIGTLLVWILYGIILRARRSGNWKGRSVMVLSIIGFAVSIFSLTIVNIFFSGFHKFY
jgi:ABC-type transport system involved in cytochrome c biogenesis permease subunit